MESECVKANKRISLELTKNINNMAKRVHYLKMGNENKSYNLFINRPPKTTTAHVTNVSHFKEFTKVGCERGKQN